MQKSLVIIFSALCLHASAEDIKKAKNQVLVSPVALSTTSAKGFSAQYERFLGSSGKLSITLPVSYSYGQTSPCDPDIKTRMFRVSPGVKFYPAGNEHRVSYAMGVNAVVGKGNSNCNCGEIVTQTTGANTSEPVAENQVVKEKTPFSTMTEAGLLFNNSINIQATKHVFIGSDLGIGGRIVNYKDLTSPDIAFRFTLNIGYKF